MGITTDLVDNLWALPALPPPPVVERTRQLILDCLGTVVVGAQTAEGEHICRYVRRYGGAGPSGVVLDGITRDPASAALANGTSGYSVGLTDTHNLSVTHPGASVIPAALAVGQAVTVTGARVLGGIVRGYEAVTRIGTAISPSHRHRGFHVTGTVNVFGAAIAAAYVLGLDRAQTIAAVGIAGSQAAGLFEFRVNGAMTMAFHAGRAAQSGVMAALLAAEGFTGPETILEGNDGFCRAYADGADLATITREIGARYELLEVGLRPYCACRYAHSAIDAVEEIRRELDGLDSAQIESVRIETHRVAVTQETRPDTLVGARLSTAFNVALAITNGPRLTEVRPPDLKREDVRRLAALVEITEDPALTALYPRIWASRVHLRLKGGRTMTVRIDVPKGDPENPLTAAEVEAKFSRLAEERIGRANSERVVAAVKAVETLPSVEAIMVPLGNPWTG